MHDTLFMCIYSSGLEYIHMYGVSFMLWSILANAPIHFGKCACPFYRMRQSILSNVSRYSGFPVFKHSGVQALGTAPLKGLILLRSQTLFEQIALTIVEYNKEHRSFDELPC